MKDKLLNSFSTESNGEIINVDVVETDKGIIINIFGTTMDVLINGEEFYSKYDQEEYRYIPSQLRSFVEENICSYGDGLRKDDSDVVCDLTLEDRDYYMMIPTKRSKNNNLRLRDWLIDYNLLVEDGKITDKNLETMKYNEFLNSIKNYGYKIQISHSGDSYDNWVDLIIPINDFNIEKIKTCLKLWQNYNEYLVNTYLNGKY